MNFNLEITCGPLEAPANGSMAVIDTGAPANGMDSIMEFRCDEGYELVGDVSLVCLDNGEWSSEAPYCASESCEGRRAEIAAFTKSVFSDPNRNFHFICLMVFQI